MVSKVVSHFGGCGFGRKIDEIDDLHHTDLTTSSSWAPRWEHMVLKFQGSHCGSTRPQAFNEAASRSPAVVDSPAALAFNEADVRVGIDNFRLCCTPRNAKEIGRTVGDSF